MIDMKKYNFMFGRLKNIREDKDLLQEDIAKILQTSKSMISKWENNTKFISLNKLKQFCNHFKVSMDYVTGLSNVNNYKGTIDIDVNIVANNLKNIRNSNNKTQKDIANLLNTSQSTISAYESGKTLIITPFLYQIALEYNESIDKICTKH